MVELPNHWIGAGFEIVGTGAAVNFMSIRMPMGRLKTARVGAVWVTSYAGAGASSILLTANRGKVTASAPATIAPCQVSSPLGEGIASNPCAVVEYCCASDSGAVTSITATIGARAGTYAAQGLATAAGERSVNKQNILAHEIDLGPFDEALIVRGTLGTANIMTIDVNWHEIPYTQRGHINGI